MIQQAKDYLKQYFGYEDFRTGQEEIITRVLQGKPTIGIMPTGGGKSLCYQIPALMFSGLTIVISPLISLMKDQVDALSQIGISATYINSSLSYKEVNERIEGLIYGQYRILYVAPERLETPAFMETLKELPVSLIAVDEAHCISQWGHDFRPSYLRIPQLIKQFEQRPAILALTATATPSVQHDICQLLHIDETEMIVTGFERSNLAFHVIRGENRLKYVEQYIKRNKNECGIIYAITRKEVDSLYHHLNKLGFLVERYHAGMSDSERSDAQDLFLRDEINVMIATNAFGMGIDKSNVRYVIHYQMPRNMESYYQEAGRAGRDGLESECILLYGAQDVQIQRFLIEQSIGNEERQHQELHKLHNMKDYCYCEGCLQAFILSYFGEKNPEKCGKCGNCTDTRELVDVTIETQMVLSCMIRMGERFGKTIIAQVLTGSTNKKVLEFHFHKLPTYGIMKNRSLKDVTDFIDFLTSEGLIGITDGKYPTLFVSNEGREVLVSRQKVMKKEQRSLREAVVQDDLFDMLRALRKEIANEEGVPPFIIISDATLKEMSVKIPTTVEELLEVKGIGEQKQQRYGARFLEVTANYKELMNEKIIVERKRKEDNTPSHLVTYELYKQGLNLQEIAVNRDLSITTVENHLLQCGMDGAEIRWNTIFTKEQELMIYNIIEEVGSEKLKPIKEKLSNDISYFMIKAALIKRKISN
ncbi:MAG: DNA helicase RecQ [Bacillaceae bacterium]